VITKAAYTVPEMAEEAVVLDQSAEDERCETSPQVEIFKELPLQFEFRPNSDTMTISPASRTVHSEIKLGNLMTNKGISETSQ
jgi:hypothetical protein